MTFLDSDSDDSSSSFNKIKPLRLNQNKSLIYNKNINKKKINHSNNNNLSVEDVLSIEIQSLVNRNKELEKIVKNQQYKYKNNSLNESISRYTDTTDNGIINDSFSTTVDDEVLIYKNLLDIQEEIENTLRIEINNLKKVSNAQREIILQWTPLIQEKTVNKKKAFINNNNNNNNNNTKIQLNELQNRLSEKDMQCLQLEKDIIQLENNVKNNSNIEIHPIETVKQNVENIEYLIKNITTASNSDSKQQQKQLYETNLNNEVEIYNNNNNINNNKTNNNYNNSNNDKIIIIKSPCTTPTRRNNKNLNNEEIIIESPLNDGNIRDKQYYSKSRTVSFGSRKIKTNQPVRNKTIIVSSTPTRIKRSKTRSLKLEKEVRDILKEIRKISR
jgi:hypothetical protein